jgi:trimeric autotransporter adhesin
LSMRLDLLVNQKIYQCRNVICAARLAFFAILVMTSAPVIANWTALGGLKNGCNRGPSISDAVASPNGDVYVCGDYVTMCTDQVVTGLAKYTKSSNSWSAVPGVERMAPDCRITLIGNRLVVATATGPTGVTNLRFTGVGNTNIAQFDLTSQTWAAIGAGINGPAYALLPDGANRLYVAGEFTSAGGVSAGRIASAELLTGAWASLSSGANGRITSIERSGNFLYAGGGFENIDGVAASKIARRNLVNGSWEPLSASATSVGEITSIASLNGELFVGGLFSSIAGINANYFAAVNEQTLVWRAMNFPSAASPSHIAKHQGKIYVSSAPGNRVFVRNSGWEEIGTGGAFATNSGRRRLAPTNDGLFAFGNITSMNAIRANGIALYSPLASSWSALGNESSLAVTLDESVDLDRVRVLVNTTQGLFAGGVFEEIGGVPSNGYARFSSTGWNDLSNASISARPRNIQAFAQLNASEIIVAGNWAPTSSGFDQYVARCQIVSGVCTTLGGGLNGSVYTVFADGNKVYLAGSFSALSATGQATKGIAVFDTTANSWLRFPVGIVGGGIYDIKKVGGDLIMGGQFTSIEGVAAQNLIRFSPANSQWQSLGTSFGNQSFVSALANSADGLFLTGSFGAINGITVNHIAHWRSSDSVLSALGSGLSGGVTTGITLKLIGDNLYTGGQFTQAGGKSVSHIAAWDTRYKVWNDVSLSGGVDDPVGTARVIAIEQVGSDIWVGGAFRTAGGRISHNLAVLEPLQLFRGGFE